MRKCTKVIFLTFVSLLPHLFSFSTVALRVLMCFGFGFGPVPPPQQLGNMRGRLQEIMSKAIFGAIYLHTKRVVSLNTVEVCQLGDSEVFSNSHVWNLGALLHTLCPLKKNQQTCVCREGGNCKEPVRVPGLCEQETSAAFAKELLV